MAQSKQRRGFSIIEGAIIIAILCIITGLAYFALTARQNDSSFKDEDKIVSAPKTTFKDGRATFYVVSGGVGGHCEYYVADKAGKRTGECVDSVLLKKLVLDTNKEYRDAVDGYLPGTTNLLLIDADIVVSTRSTRNGSQFGDPKTKNVLVLSQVYSVTIYPVTRPQS